MAGVPVVVVPRLITSHIFLVHGQLRSVLMFVVCGSETDLLLEDEASVALCELVVSRYLDLGIPLEETASEVF